jgi:LacI family transcriptional regulator
VNDEAIGAMGADHLLERGFKRFAFVGIEGENWSEARQSAFIRHLASDGLSVSVRSVPRHHVDDISWEVHQSCLADWISKLPKPVGIMVCSDQRGGQVLEACRRAGVRVPDDVAVIGVDNDQALCGVCNPPLSSVWPNHSHVGYEAAKLLERLIRREKNVPRRTLIPPKGIVTRLSSDTLSVDDPLAANILRIIRERACMGIRIDDIASVVGASRSVIQRRFRNAFGRSMNEALVQHRLNAAKTLLLETELPLIEIAERCGFRHQEYMGAVFKLYLKQTPAQFRALLSLRL